MALLTTSAVLLALLVALFFVAVWAVAFHVLLSREFAAVQRDMAVVACMLDDLETKMAACRVKDGAR